MKWLLINSGMANPIVHAYHQGQLGILDGLAECGEEVVGWGPCREQAGRLSVDVILSGVYGGDLEYAFSGGIKTRWVIPYVPPVDSGVVSSVFPPGVVPFVLGLAESPDTRDFYGGRYHVLPFGAPDIPFRAKPPESPFAWVFAGGKSHRGQVWDDYIAPLMIESHKRKIPFLVSNENAVCVSDPKFLPMLSELMDVSRVYGYIPGWEAESAEVQAKRTVTEIDGDLDVARRAVLRWTTLMDTLYPGVRVCPNVHCAEQKQGTASLSSPTEGGTVRQDANQRLFDIPAASGLQVCDWSPLLEVYFDQHEVLYADSPGWWVDNVIEWSEPRNARTVYRRRAGWERVQREHLWRHRAKTLIGWLKEAIG